MSHARRRVVFSKKVHKQDGGALELLHVQAHTLACPTRAQIQERGAQVAAERETLLRSRTEVAALLALGVAAKLRGEVEEYMAEPCQQGYVGMTFQALDDARYDLLDDAPIAVNHDEDAPARAASGRADFPQTYDADDMEYFFGGTRTWAEALMHKEAACEIIVIAPCAQDRVDETLRKPVKPDMLQVETLDVDQDREDDHAHDDDTSVVPRKLEAMKPEVLQVDTLDVDQGREVDQDHDDDTSVVPRKLEAMKPEMLQVGTPDVDQGREDVQGHEDDNSVASRKLEADEGRDDDQALEDDNVIVPHVTRGADEGGGLRGVILPPIDLAEQRQPLALAPSRPKGSSPVLTRPMPFVPVDAM
eukprot:TRINITY_DN6830_c0_g1_i1.p1 TRINITY_DN6830_c0_g1~~TRINITY_DN6830_c0_g1_i1.p1  ORF type:complete len:361 (-),score=77.34 TRINITY_DN6830_c0_g1_i1:247-1329(-)